MVDLFTLHVPLAQFPEEEPGALRERLIAALRACAAECLPGRVVEVGYEDERLTVRSFVAVTADNLDAARRFGRCEVGEQIGFDVWDGPEEGLEFLGVELADWEELRDRGERALRWILMPDLRERRAALGPWLKDHEAELAGRRTARVPEVRPGLPEVLDGVTYYGGPAWLRDGEAWPVCACGAALELLLHLHVPDGAEVAAGRMYEVFQCTRCGRGELARAVAADARPRTSPVARPRCRAKQVVRWRDEADYSGFACDDEEFKEVFALRGDKLGGWPARLQASREEAFPCSVCGADTVRLYQLDARGPCEWNFGDLGRAWLSVCARHPEAPVYFWECS